jgi:hypothetical protein
MKIDSAAEAAQQKSPAVGTHPTNGRMGRAAIACWSLLRDAGPPRSYGVKSLSIKHRGAARWALAAVEHWVETSMLFVVKKPEFEHAIRIARDDGTKET